MNPAAGRYVVSAVPIRVPKMRISFALVVVYAPDVELVTLVLVPPVDVASSTFEVAAPVMS